MAKLIGNKPNQVPTNGDLGTLAFQDSDNVIVENLTVSGSSSKLVVEDNSTDAALRVTQTGTGNALVVEDSANPDATPFVVEASGDVLIGTPTSIPGAFSDTGKLQISQNTGEAVQHNYAFINNAGSGSFIYLNKSRSSTIGTNTIVQNGDNFGGIVFAGADGTTYHRGAAIDAFVDGTPGTNDMPGRLVFSTTADGASSPTERMRIDSNGNVGIGVSSPSEKLDVSGAIKVQPSGTPTWDTTPRFWTESGFGARYDGYQHRFDIGNSRTQALLIDYSGNVGIGTNLPEARLEILTGTSTKSWSASTTYGLLLERSGDNTLAIVANAASTAQVRFGDPDSASVGALQYVHSDNSMRFRVNESERMRIDSSGKVGIGTSSPSEILVLSAANNPRLAFEDEGNFEYTIGIKDNDAFTISSGGTDTERMRIDSSGNVGIGTSSPAQIFHLQGSGAAARIDNSDLGSNVYGDILSETGGLLTLRSRGGASTHGSIDIRTWNGTDDLSRMRIDSNGNVGIGTSSPSAKLELFGGSIKSTSATYNYLSVNSTGVEGQFAANSSGTVNVRAVSNHPLTLFTNNTERMRIDSSGNVGIGTSSPTEKLHVSGNVKADLFASNYIYSVSGTTSLNIGTNLTSANLYIGATTMTGTMYVGRSDDTSTLHIGSGSVGAGETKTITIGKYGSTGSTTQISIGTEYGGGTTTFWNTTTFYNDVTFGTGWKIVRDSSSTDLFFYYFGTKKMKLDTSGNLSVTGDVTAFATL